ncbi:MAG: MBL fold metallo-hydrolase [Chloroflexota bacterium]|nr:MBL fold metallo-hydrolase [Chloroflexota bacterium]MDE2919450.1 MBL fold metallo-hydrolase [Chloroflexota bacterium]
MRLTQRVHLVGSGATGADLSNPYDCHVYLVDGGGPLALIDAGVGLEPELILANVRAAGFDPANIETVALTHAHADHGGGSGPLHELTGAEVLAPGPAADWLRQADEESISLPRARAGGTYPSDFHLPPCSSAVSIAEGDTIQVGEARLSPIDTPGHARVHVSYLLEGDDRPGLFGGDVVFREGKILLLSTPDCSIQDLVVTMRRLGELDFEALYPGHAGVSLRRGRQHVDAALRVFDAEEIPPNFNA